MDMKKCIRGSAKLCTTSPLCRETIFRSRPPCPGRHHRGALFVVKADNKIADKAEEAVQKTGKTAEEITEKYGLEAGLWNVFRNKDEPTGKGRGTQAKDLLKRYGSAYLITSITLSLFSFGLCYALVNSGVDVAALLSKVGLTVSGTGERVGAVAIAYAAHKALSPVRFPPTVALTPVVAKFLGKEPAKTE